MDFRDPRLHVFRHFPAVLARQHHRSSDDRLPAVERRSAGAKFRSRFHFGNVLNQNRLDRAAEPQRKLADFLRAVHAADGANRELLSTPADDPATRILSILRHEVRQIAEGHASGCQRLRPGLDHELPFVPAALVDLRDAGYRAQERLDGVFLDFAEFQKLIEFRRGLVRGVGAILDVVIKDFAETRADRRKLRGCARRQALQHTLQTFGDQLPRAIDIGAIPEIQRDLRETELRQRPHFLHSRQARHFKLNWLRDELF